MRLRPILRLLLAGLLAGTALLAPAPWPTVRTGVINHAPTAHADGPNDWPMFGHDPARTGFNPNETTLQPPLSLKWTYTTGATFAGSPAVVNGAVYVGSTSDRKLYALDAAIGALKWAYTLGGPRTPARQSPTVSFTLVQTLMINCMHSTPFLARSSGATWLSAA